MFKKPIRYWSEHIILSNLSHAVGGFGAAILLQYYLEGSAFLSAIVGWLALGFTLITHFFAWISK